MQAMFSRAHLTGMATSLADERRSPSWRLRRSLMRRAWSTAPPHARVALLVLGFLAIGLRAAAHPAVGIVVDGQGAVFYSDTVQVWRIAPDGSKSIAVPDVHTHELWLAADGSLFGEHLRYVDRRWEHRVWKRSPDGMVTDHIGMRSGFREDYRDFFFARDARGAMYWLDGRSPAAVRTRLDNGPIRTIAELPGKDPVWLAATPDGSVLFSSQGSIWRLLADGRLTHLSDAVSRSRNRYAVMGLAEDARGNVYAAAYADRAVRRLTPSGQVTTVTTTPEPWGPTGVAAAADGTLWILEASVTNAQRVRRIDRSGRVRVY